MSFDIERQLDFQRCLQVGAQEKIMGIFRIKKMDVCLLKNLRCSAICGSNGHQHVSLIVRRPVQVVVHMKNLWRSIVDIFVRKNPTPNMS